MNLDYHYVSFHDFMVKKFNKSNIYLASDVTICRQNMPTKERNECIKENVKKLVPLFKVGIVSFQSKQFDQKLFFLSQ